MEKELNEAGAAGYRFVSVRGGETAVGKEVVVLMEKPDGASTHYQYRLLATNRTSTLEKELQAAGDEGFDIVGQAQFESAFGGKEAVAILQRVEGAPVTRYQYRLLATNKTSTMQKELEAAARQGYVAIALTVGQTSGGAELVVVTRRKAP